MLIKKVKITIAIIIAVHSPTTERFIYRFVKVSIDVCKMIVNMH